MPITKPERVSAWRGSDGMLHLTASEWQKAELGIMFAEAGHPLLDAILAKRDEVVAILTTGPRSRPKARKVAGTTAPRRAVKRATPEQARAGFKAMHEAASGGVNATKDGDVPAEPFQPTRDGHGVATTSVAPVGAEIA